MGASGGSGRSWLGVALVTGIALVVIAIDQATKLWAIANLQGQPSIQVVGEWLQLTFVRNPGAAFSIGTEYTGLFTAAATVVSVAVLIAASRVRSRWWWLAMGLLLGGAVGNLIDRVVQPPGGGSGHVVDFLQLPNWPVFNVADMAVVGAAILMVVLSILGVDPSGRPTDVIDAPPGAEPGDDPAPQQGRVSDTGGTSAGPDRADGADSTDAVGAERT